MGEFDAGFTLYVGNMFGGKTASMITDLETARDHLERKVQMFKLEADDRYKRGYVTANNGKLEFPATEVSDASEIEKKLLEGVEVVGIDELQFFDPRIIDFIQNYRSKLKIFGTGLLLDYRGEPFALRKIGDTKKDSKINIGQIMAWADPVIFKFPNCIEKIGRKLCGNEARYIQRLKDDETFSRYNEDTMVVGGVKSYLPRCKEHFVFPERNP